MRRRKKSLTWTLSHLLNRDPKQYKRRGHLERSPVDPFSRGLVAWEGELAWEGTLGVPDVLTPVFLWVIETKEERTDGVRYNVAEISTETRVKERRESPLHGERRVLATLCGNHSDDKLGGGNSLVIQGIRQSLGPENCGLPADCAATKEGASSYPGGGGGQGQISSAPRVLGLRGKERSPTSRTFTKGGAGKIEAENSF